MMLGGAMTTKYDNLINKLFEYRFVFQEIQKALYGVKPTDYGLSSPIVQRAWDLYLENKGLKKQLEGDGDGG